MSINTAGPIEITVPLDEIQYLESRFSRAVGMALYRARKRLETELLEVVPFRTGELFESMKVWAAGDEGVKITFDAPYARIVEMGAEAHSIDAAEGGPLLHFWKDGREIFTRHVDHPGYSGRGFLWKVKEMVVRVAQEELAIAILSMNMR